MDRHTVGISGATRTHDDDVGPADVLGVSRLPPGGVARLGNRVRAGLSRTTRALDPPPGAIMDAALGGLDLAGMAALCHLDLPDRLTDPTTPAELAAELGVDCTRLTRLLRYAATRRWVRLDRHGRLHPTRTLAFLRRDHPGGWRAWVEFASGDEISAALGSLHEGLHADGDAFEAANGAPFFAWMQQHPDRHTTFDAAMSAGGRMHGLLLADALDWSAARRVCDVGGGDGSVLGVLRAHHPHLEGVLLELPEVVARAPDRAGVERVAGDAFEAVPLGCDTYLLINVVHDWADNAVVHLLERIADAIRGPGSPDDARVIVVESVAHARPRDDLAVRADLLMLALTPGGRERTTEEIAGLAGRAGLVLRRRRRLVTGDAAYVLHVRPRHRTDAAEHRRRRRPGRKARPGSATDGCAGPGRAPRAARPSRRAWG
jgi:hypothetical protein